MPKEGPEPFIERREAIEDPTAEYSKAITGIATRVLREATPLDQMRIREKGKDREQLLNHVREYIRNMFGLDTNESSKKK